MGEAGKIWAVPNPSSRSDDWLSFQFFKVGGAGLSRRGAALGWRWPCREERSRRKGKELDRTWERRVAAGLGPPGNATVEPAKVWFRLLAVVYVSLYFFCLCFFL